MRKDEEEREENMMTDGDRPCRGRLIAGIVLFMAGFFLCLSPSQAAKPTHLDRAVLPRGCSSCHRGHGLSGTAMLVDSKDDLCFECHGPVKKGIPGEAKTDIYDVLLKKSHHPILQTSKYHIRGEILPEISPSAPRHVSCYDCHNAHLSEEGDTFRGVPGYSEGRGKMKSAEREYEVCYLCHSDSANLPPGSSNIARKFDPGNASYHPVESEGKDGRVPSLRGVWNRLMSCSDCHGNNDKFGPKGPHGSDYDNLLKANYTTEPGPESAFAYALCYGCHNRNSILNDESFSAHKRHVVYGDVPCFACHDSHGSRDYDNLVRFYTREAFPNSQGQFSYMKVAPGKPRCFLDCHIRGMTYDHKIKEGQYCVNDDCLPEW